MEAQSVGRERREVRLSVHVNRDARSVALAGELDIAAVPLLFVGLASLLEPPGEITIDLTQLTFIDASGLGAAVRIRNSQLASGFDLHIIGANCLVTRVFSLGGLAPLLDPTQ